MTLATQLDPSFALAFRQDDHPFGVLVGVSMGTRASQVSAAALEQLVPAERAVAETLRGFRQTQWVGARIAWRVIATQLGCSDAPLLRSESGAPYGPPHLSVSVAHKPTMAIVLAGSRSAGSLGVDLEDDEAAAEAIEHLVFDEEERAAFATMSPAARARARVTAFSFKESIYKAHGDVEQRALTYSDASITFDASGIVTGVTMRPPHPFPMQIWAESRGGQIMTAVRRSSSLR
jgi:4'-phosphopantetheinyl transferase EntD